jgi:branched-chain amino acid transport system substrate-binding protein
MHRRTPGVTATEIKIGNTLGYTGPYATEAKGQAAVFRMINDKGDINGRRITFVSRDDGSDPHRTVELTRQLVEEEQVAFIFHGFGTLTQLAVREYMNAKGVPQLFVGSTRDIFGDPEHYHWTMAFPPSLRTEAAIYGEYLLRKKPEAKVGVLYQNDGFGTEHLVGLKQSLVDQYGKIVVKEVSYETTDSAIDNQLVALRSAGADVVISAVTPKFAVKTIRKMAEVNWKPLHMVPHISVLVDEVLAPAGLENTMGLISAAWVKDPTDPRWADDPGMNEWRTFMKAYLPDGDLTDPNYIWAYAVSLAVVQVLKQCGNDISRESIMREAANLHDLELPVVLPGIRVNTSPTNYHPITSMQLQRWNGKSWDLFGDVIAAS